MQSAVGYSGAAKLPPRPPDDAETFAASAAADLRGPLRRSRGSPPEHEGTDALVDSPAAVGADVFPAAPQRRAGLGAARRPFRTSSATASWATRKGERSRRRCSTGHRMPRTSTRRTRYTASDCAKILEGSNCSTACENRRTVRTSGCSTTLAVAEKPGIHELIDILWVLFSTRGRNKFDQQCSARIPSGIPRMTWSPATGTKRRIARRRQAASVSKRDRIARHSNAAGQAPRELRKVFDSIAYVACVGIGRCESGSSSAVWTSFGNGYRPSRGLVARRRRPPPRRPRFARSTSVNAWKISETNSTALGGHDAVWSR